MLNIKNISIAYEKKKVIKELSLRLEQGEFCALLGPNGAGKSSLLKALIGYLKLTKGRIFLKGKEISKWEKIKLAQNIAIIPQDFQLQFDHSVKDLVLMGRFPYLDRFQNYSSQDRKIVQNILEELDLQNLQHKYFSKLSGGERRRVSIARALAQETDILLMDEAFANLDINHQLEIMKILWKINREKNKLIILVSHNINLTSEYCDRIILLKSGKIIADGKAKDTITAENLEILYSTRLKIILNEISGKPNLVYPGKDV